MDLQLCSYIVDNGTDKVTNNTKPIDPKNEPYESYLNSLCNDIQCYEALQRMVHGDPTSTKSASSTTEKET